MASSTFPHFDRNMNTGKVPNELPRSIRLAGSLFLVSGITHLVQVFVYDEPRILIGVSIFGVIYLVIGWFLLRQRRAALWAGAILPVLGGAAGTYRFLFVQPNPFSAWHVAIDFVVVPVCIYWLTRFER